MRNIISIIGRLFHRKKGHEPISCGHSGGIHVRGHIMELAASRDFILCKDCIRQKVSDGILIEIL